MLIIPLPATKTFPMVVSHVNRQSKHFSRAKPAQQHLTQSQTAQEPSNMCQQHKNQNTSIARTTKQWSDTRARAKPTCVPS